GRSRRRRRRGRRRSFPRRALRACPGHARPMVARGDGPRHGEGRAAPPADEVQNGRRRGARGAPSPPARQRRMTAASPPLADSRQAWIRLSVGLALMTIGSAAMYVVSVVLPSVQKEFNVARADASLPYTLLMIGFGIGGIFMGRLADKRGVMLPILIGAVGLAAGFVLAGLSGGIVTFAIVHGLLLGFAGSSATFAPLVADASLWFVKRRGTAVAICASGNYLAGAIWPPIVQHFVETIGWRQTYIGMGVFCAVTMPLLALAMRARPPALVAVEARQGAATPSTRPFGLSMNAAQGLLCIAGVACCVAMSMPQVHIVAYCGDLGY